jgi:hypothetical protein
VAVKTVVKIGVLGSDARAAAMGRLLFGAGHDVYSGDVGDGAAVCDMLIFAGPRSATDAIVAELGEIGNQTIVVDAMKGTLPEDLDGTALLAGKLGTYRVVRALIALPRAGSHVLMWGSDPGDMQVVAGVFRAAGCVTTACDPTLNRTGPTHAAKAVAVAND